MPPVSIGPDITVTREKVAKFLYRNDGNPNLPQPRIWGVADPVLEGQVPGACRRATGRDNGGTTRHCVEYHRLKYLLTVSKIARLRLSVLF